MVEATRPVRYGPHGAHCCTCTLASCSVVDVRMLSCRHASVVLLGVFSIEQQGWFTVRTLVFASGTRLGGSVRRTLQFDAVADRIHQC